MRVILLTRNCPFQVFCANTLWRRGLLTSVIIEEGYSFPTGNSLKSHRVVTRNIRNIASIVRARLGASLDYAKFYFNRDKYFGSQELHNKRLLQADYHALAADLPAIVVRDVNSDQVKNAIRESSPQIVLVFGTRLLKPATFEGHSAKFVNMHWGWSPNYRGEGIVSALALEGPAALGVTVHLISSKADAGAILYQSRPTVDPDDNFYSIGLKLTLLGIDLFAKAIGRQRTMGELAANPQDLSKGRLFDSKYMKSHPELYNKAWNALKA
jgi:methionyl-tRNA formyltransferase